jgi:hypothetical protein
LLIRERLERYAERGFVRGTIGRINGAALGVSVRALGRFAVLGLERETVVVELRPIPFAALVDPHAADS